MDWPSFKLLSPIDLLEPAGILVNEGPGEKCPDAIERKYEIDQGFIILVEWRHRLHSVIYQTPLEDDDARTSRMVELFEFYGEGHSWNEVLDNGFGISFRRSDEKRFALWSYVMDFQTFGTMEFHEVKWG